MKHFMIAANSGCDKSLKSVGEGYKEGLVTKDEYTMTLRAYKDSMDEMKSDQRTKAEAKLKRLGLTESHKCEKKTVSIGAVL